MDHASLADQQVPGFTCVCTTSAGVKVCTTIHRLYTCVLEGKLRSHTFAVSTLFIEPSPGPITLCSYWCYRTPVLGLGSQTPEQRDYGNPAGGRQDFPLSVRILSVKSTVVTLGSGAVPYVRSNAWALVYH